MIHRRTFIGTLTGALLAAPVAARAQQAKNVARVGHLAWFPLGSPETRVVLGAFRQGLRERGYVEGQNIVIEYRSTDGKIDRLPRLATDLARLKVDLSVVASTPMARAVQQATITIPIVAWVMGDPVGDGLVASLAEPDGNITGSTFLGPELTPKRLELLKEAFPKVTRGTDPGSATSTRGRAESGRIRSRILHDDEGARRGPRPVSEPDALQRAKAHRRPRHRAVPT